MLSQQTASFSQDRSFRDIAVWGLVVVLAVVFIALFLISAFQFMSFPYEIDWYEGVMLDHAARLHTGLDIFTQPSHIFVPAIYPPLFSVFAAAAMNFFGVTYQAGRIISLCSTAFALISIVCILRPIGQRVFPAVLGCAFLVATIQMTGYAHLIARTDALLVGLLAVSTLFASRWPGRTGAAASALALTLGFLTKQQALLYAPVIAIWLIRKNRQAGVVFVLTLVLGCFGLVGLLESQSDHWYSYYIFHVPSFKARVFGWWRTVTVFPLYVFSRFGIGSLVIILGASIWIRAKQYFDSHSGLLVLLFFTAIVQTALHLGDQMSSSNTVLPLALFFALAFVAVFIELSRDNFWRPMLPWAVAMQLLALLYNPFAEPYGWIRNEHYLAGAHLKLELASLSGDVYLPAHSFIARQLGKGQFANVQTARDILYMEDGVARALSKDLDSQLLTRRYDAVILDQNPFFSPDSLKGYYFARLINNGTDVFGSRFGNVLTIPRYLYLPYPRR